MKAESTILVSLATGVASVCLLLTCLNMYMLNNMRTTLKSLDGRLSDAPEDIFSSALVEDKQPSNPEKDEVIAALYRHLEHQNNQIAQYEMKLHHLAELHEHRNRLLAEQEAVRQNHLQAQTYLEKQKRRLAKRLTKFQLEKQAHEHQKEIEEYERQLHQTFDQLYELQRRQEEQQVRPIDDVFAPESDYPAEPEGVVFMVQHENDFPFSPLEMFLSHIFGAPFVGEDNPAVTVSLETVQDADNTEPDHPDFAEEPTPVEDADVLADTDDSHVVVNRVLPSLDDMPSMEDMPSLEHMPTATPEPVLPTPVA